MLKNKIMKSINILLILIIMCINILPTYASSEGGIEIVATYSSDIEPTSGDIFVLTYRKVGGKTTSTIEVDASLVKNVGRVIAIDPDTYIIDSIEYKGTNSAIIDSGYASNNRIRAGYTQSGTLRILVGFNAMKSYSKSYKDDFVVDEITFYDYDKMNELGKINPQWYEETGTEMPEDVYEYYMAIDAPTGYNTEPDPSIEEPSNNPSEELPWSVIPSVPENNGGEIVVEPNNPEPSIGKPIEKVNNAQMAIFFGGALIVVIGTIIILKKKNII